MTTFEAKMKLDAADVNYRARLAAINDVHKAEKEQIVIEFLGDKLACIDDIIKNESGRFLKVEERYIDIRYENRAIVVQYKGTRCTENGEPFKRDRTISRTDVFDLTK